MRNSFLEKFLIDTVKVDGLDATDKVLNFIAEAGELDLVLLHGIPYAGFNLIDAYKIYEETRCPVICILDRKPDMARVERALRLKFPDWLERIEILKKQSKPAEFSLNNKSLIISVQGLNPEEALRRLRRITFLGKRPEPLRVARLIAEGLPPLLLN